MRLIKTPEEREAARERRAQARFERSPVGRATAAHEQGDPLFQVSLPVEEDSAATLSKIEAIGWRLEHAGYASKISSYSSTNSNGALASVDINSQVMGVYLFRRT